MSKRLETKAVEKARRKIAFVEMFLRRDAINKSIARHNGRNAGTDNAFRKWGEKFSILRAILSEIEPKLESIRSAEDFLNYGYGKQRKAARR